MSEKSENATNRIMLAFQSGGIVPLGKDKYDLIDEHVRSILKRAMETGKEKNKRKWEGFQRALKEREG